MAWRFTVPTATCSTNSCRAAPTSAQTVMAGSLENRARLMLDVTDAVIAVWGTGPVGMHLAPRADAHDMGDANRSETFTYVARELGKRGIAFICAREKKADDSLSPSLKQAFGGVLIANPDLPARLAQDAELNTPHPDTFYGKGPAGYIDYPTL
jgi:2,4-dienoyl-CoA reductase-like NADH-dependent reductase (Old Yellow Enzyme family)